MFEDDAIVFPGNSEEFLEKNTGVLIIKKQIDKQYLFILKIVFLEWDGGGTHL